MTGQLVDKGNPARVLTCVFLIGRHKQCRPSHDLYNSANDDANQIITGALYIDLVICRKFMDKSSQQWVDIDSNYRFT